MADKSNKNRYSGKDSVTWVVADVTGKQIGKETHDGFGAAQTAAKRHTLETGVFAVAKRQ